MRVVYCCDTNDAENLDELLAILQRFLVNTAIDMATLLGMPVSDMVPDVVARVSVHTSQIVMPLLNHE